MHFSDAGHAGMSTTGQFDKSKPRLLMIADERNKHSSDFNDNAKMISLVHHKAKDSFFIFIL